MSALEFRASDAPLGILCPESIRQDGGIRISMAQAQANLGTATHRVAESIVEKKSMPDLHAIAIGAGLTVQQMEEFEILTRTVQKIWGRISDAFPNPRCELEFEQKYFLHTGDSEPAVFRTHPDITSMNTWESPTRCRVLDWKTGRTDLEFWAQMMFELMVIAREYPSIEQFQWSIIKLREMKAESNILPGKPYLTREDIGAFETFYLNQARLMLRGGYFVPGEHCRWCRRIRRCDAQRETALATVTSLDPEWIENGCTELTDAGAVEFYEKLKQVERLVEMALEHIKARAQAAGGVLHGEHGRLQVTDVTQLEIDPQRAWPLMQEALSAEAIAGCIRVSKTGLEKAIRATAPNRQKKATWEVFLDRLRESEAVSEKIVSRCQLSKKRLEITGELSA